MTYAGTKPPPARRPPATSHAATVGDAVRGGLVALALLCAGCLGRGAGESGAGQGPAEGSAATPTPRAAGNTPVTGADGQPLASNGASAAASSAAGPAASPNTPSSGAPAPTSTGIGPPPGSVVTDTDLAKVRCQAANPNTGEAPLPTVALPAARGLGLSTSGNQIIGPDGQPFRGRGANLACPRGCGACACNGTSLAASASEVIRRIDALVDDWHANIIRLHLESYAAGAQDVVVDPAYLSALQQIVAHVATRGDVVLILAIWFDPSLDANGWPTPATDQQLGLLASQFAKVPQIAFAVSNEPQSNNDGALDAQAWARMNSAVAAIRAAEVQAQVTPHLVLVQGTGGWARRLDYYLTHPITAGNGKNIAYETHVYDHVDAFSSRFVGPAKTLPVIIGEFGPLGDGTMTLADTQALMVAAETAGVPYLAWTFHGRCVPSLLVDQDPGGCGVGMPLVPSSWGQQLKTQLAQPWGASRP